MAITTVIEDVGWPISILALMAVLAVAAILLFIWLLKIVEKKDESK